MNSFQDPSKKSSITSLLNPPSAPDAATGFPQSSGARIPSPAVNQRLPLPQGHQPAPYTNTNAPYTNTSSFHLRAANWGGPGNAPENSTNSISSNHYNNGASGYHLDRRVEPFIKRLATSMDTPGRSTYQPSKPDSMSAPEGQPKNYHPPMGRHRATSIQSMTGIESGQGWKRSADPPTNNSSYGPAPPHSMHSDSRSAMSNSSQSQTGYQNTAVRGLISSPAPSQSQLPPQYYVAPYPILVSYPSPGIPSSQDQVLPPLQHLQQASARTPSTSSKRQLPESEAPIPKAKRPAKAKPKVTADGIPTPPSKRGFNAKKRSEAAQIAAQNAQLTATASIGDKGEDKAAGCEGSILREVQFARCMSNRYRTEDFPRCVSCTRRWAGDTCRFQGIRCFIKDAKKEIVAVSFMNAKPGDIPALQFPNSWNVPLKQEHIDRCKKVIAKAILSTLKVEREHLDLGDLIRRARESDVRVTCDTCMTSIFSSSWMCRLCGREACADCFAQVSELTEDRPRATPAEIVEMQKKREKHAHSNPFFLSCTKRNEHRVDSFSPMSRFFADELNVAIKEMEKILADEEGKETEEVSRSEPSGGKIADQAGERPADSFAEGDGPINWSEVYKSKEIKCDIYPRSLWPSGTAGENYVPPNLPEAVTTTPYYKLCRYSDNDVTAIDSADKFAKIWGYGEPVLVANILNKFKIDWSPEYFAQEFGDRECLITECEQDANKKTTIKQFFGQFGKYADRKDVWKLKDWPPSADFKTAFPKLYKDFSEAVPVPDYVRRDGVYNIGSHFPSNVVGPDLGPKMYNAWAANQNPGSKGSTRLHMDMADALNVMLYAAACPDGSPGCAVWDIYRAEDSDKIRGFLRNRHSLGPNYDPIHGQQYYLDDLLRSQLYKEYGVCSYRVYQRPGEAIFVPAGCAHQVSNLADSIKIAIDYVSPENIDRCAQLTKEFREQNKSKVWKEDVLQLKTMMWFAWLSCSKQEKTLRGEAADRDSATTTDGGHDSANGSPSSSKSKSSAGNS